MMPISWLLLLCGAVGGLLAQSQPPDDERTAEIKRRVVAILQISPGSVVADVGCGDGLSYTIAIAKATGPSGKVYAEDIDEKALVKLKQNLAAEHLDIAPELHVVDPGYGDRNHEDAAQGPQQQTGIHFATHGGKITPKRKKRQAIPKWVSPV